MVAVYIMLSYMVLLLLFLLFVLFCFFVAVMAVNVVVIVVGVVLICIYGVDVGGGMFGWMMLCCWYCRRCS